ncbi:MAG: hypothetical protein H6925_04720 [Holosporaceae bacterium]|nr:MAG: hypothetical protein H6925_04720 [Holosporaceae bacterium]
MLFILCATTLTVAMVKDQRSYHLITQNSARPVETEHTTQADAIFEEMKIPKHLQRALTEEERQKMAFELSRLYARNMVLICQFEENPHTPHPDPDDWAEGRLKEWQAEAKTAANQGEAVSPEEADGYVVDEARSEMAELIKNNEGLENMRAAQGMAHLKDS